MNGRYSIQKQAILDALGRLDHPTAQEVLAEVQKQYPRISKGTVYRNLNLLVESGEIQRLFFPGSPDRFDVETRPHNHVRCVRCGRIFNLQTDHMREIDREVERETGFKIERHSISFEGVCPWCKPGEHK